MTQKTKDEVKEWLTWGMRFLIGSMCLYISSHVTDTNRSLAESTKANALNAKSIESLAKEFHIKMDVVDYRINTVDNRISELEKRKANR